MNRIRKENYKSDLELEVILTLGGVEIPVPDHDFMLVFYTTKKKKYKCIHDGASWIDCKVVDGRLRCYLDNHGLGAGIMHVEYYDYIPDEDFRDGNQLKVVPRALDLELVYGAGDDATEITIEVATDITAAVARANAIAAELEEKAATDYYRGVGVENVEQTTKSYEDGGENIVTITLTDGKQRTFSVFNGNISGNYYSKEQVDNKLESKATLVDGKVPLSQLPDMVDDVLDGRYKDGQFYPAEYNPDLPDYIPDVEPYTPVRGKLYIDTSNNKCYRWDGNSYVEIAARVDAALLAEKANLKSLYRFAGFSIIADGSPEDAAMAFGPYVDVLSGKLDTYCPGWGDVADHRSILQLIRWNNAGSYNSEYLFTGAFGDGLRRAASEAHEFGFNSLVFPADLVVYEAGVDMLEERIDAVERDKADKSEIDAQKPLVLTTGTNSSGETIVTTPISEIRSAVAAGRDVQYTMTYNTVKVTLHLVDYISTSNYVMMNLSCVSRIGGRNIHIVSCEYLADMMEMSFTHEVTPFAELTARQIANVFAEFDLE